MTEFIAASIASLLHCLCLLHLATLKAAGADFDLGLPLFLCPLGCKGRR